MKRPNVPFLLRFGSFASAVSLLILPVPAQSQEALLRGRPVAAWVSEVDLGGRPGDTNTAESVLLSAGPKVLPALSQLLVGNESLKDILMRLPGVPAEAKNLQAITSQTLLFKAKTASVIGGIVYRNPNAFEVRETIPFLVTALGSSSREIRYRSAQALGAAGKGASNAVPSLISCTRDDDPGVRMSSVEALGRIGTGTVKVIHALTSASSDTNIDVRITAKQALEAIQSAK